MGKRGKKAENPYASVSYSVVESTGRPGTPHRFFESSHLLLSADTSEAATCTTSSTVEMRTQENRAEEVQLTGQVIHRHVNGLCVVTVGKNLKGTIDMAGGIEHVIFTRNCGENFGSVGGKRKKKKTMNGVGDSNAVKPNDEIARVRFRNGTGVSVKSGVFGNLIELNTRLLDYPLLLERDPLLDGWIAIIMPVFSFPPKGKEFVAAEPVATEQLSDEAARKDAHSQT